MEEIAAIAQILNVMFQGLSLALKVGDKSLDTGERVLKLFGNMVAAPVKGAKKAATWAKYHKETGSTNLKNLNVRAGGDLSFLKLDKAFFDKYVKKALKKSGVLYTAMPPLKGGDSESIHLIFASADMARVSAVLEELKKYYIERQKKHGMSAEEAEKVFKDKNSVETVDEMMQGIGAMGDFEDFVSQIETIFGKDYTADMVREESVYYADEKLGFSKVLGWVPATEIDSKLEELAKAIKEKQNLEGVKTVGISFEHNPNDPENSHIVGQTEDYIKVQLNERGKACVMIPKEYVLGDLSKVSPDGKFSAHIPEDMELLVVDIDEKSAAFSMPAKEFVEKYKNWEEQALEKMGEAKKDTREKPENKKSSKRFSDTERYKKITIDRTLIQTPFKLSEQKTSQKEIVARVPNTGMNWYLKLKPGEYSVINDGKTFLTKLDMEKQYQVYDKKKGCNISVSGETLYERFDRVNQLSKKQVTAASQQKFNMGAERKR